MPTVFLDRDGVINENRDDHVKSWAEFRFLPGALDALRLLTRQGFRIFVITNQACVNRGLAKPADVDDIHWRMAYAALAHGARINDVRYCPHRPDEACPCRKPQPGMLLDLELTYGVGLGEAYLVGDAASDIAAGRAVGCRTVMVRTGRGEQHLTSGATIACPPDAVADDLLTAALLISAWEHAHRHAYPFVPGRTQPIGAGVEG
jgi:D-glycero-D-manno-heptose 1,7-bisphosphate phosphatase